VHTHTRHAHHAVLTPPPGRLAGGTHSVQCTVRTVCIHATWYLNRLDPGLRLNLFKPPFDLRSSPPPGSRGTKPTFRRSPRIRPRNHPTMITGHDWWLVGPVGGCEQCMTLHCTRISVHAMSNVLHTARTRYCESLCESLLESLFEHSCRHQTGAPGEVMDAPQRELRGAYHMRAIICRGLVTSLDFFSLLFLASRNRLPFGQCQW
jgi:hypothetical protein